VAAAGVPKELVMRDWNVIVSVYQEGFRRVLKALRQLAPTERSNYYNVLIMKADDPIALLAAIEKKTEESTALYDAISRVAPATRCFEFHSAGEFVEKAMQVIAEWSTQIAGRAFHVRLHRRGAKYDLGTQDAERLFDEAILDATAKAGTPCKISFTDPDAVIAIDTIDDRAGLALWTREDLARHRLLRPD
jgi:tRNA(Ser,Leu) C12 N-acetylase TAN1